MKKSLLFGLVVFVILVALSIYYYNVTGNVISSLGQSYNAEQMAVFRTNTGEWFMRSENGSTTKVQWGTEGDISIPADYDGDGQTDIAIYRPQNRRWYINLESNKLSHLASQKFSQDGFDYYKIPGNNENDIPVPADYDGDGKTDIAVFNSLLGNWHYINRDGVKRSKTFGDFGENVIPVPADYDGDGKTDFATYKKSDANWKILYANGTIRNYQYGWDKTVPVPADYDGDGKTDIAVYNPKTSDWYVFGSTDPIQWGFAGVIPANLPYYLRDDFQMGGSNIGDIGAEESVGSGGRIPTIATDTNNNPHIASDVWIQGKVLLFHKINGAWTGSDFNTGGSQFFNPRIEINDYDQAWISGVKWHPDAMGLIYFEDIAVNPVVTDYISSVKGGHCCLPIGLIGINPTKKDECVVWAGNGGYYEIFGVSSNRLSSLGTGYMESGKGGEVNSFSISKDGTVWHAATGVYQNSLRNAAGQGVIGWSNYMVGGNSGTGDDGEYQALTSDLEDPKVAYIASSRGGGHEKAIVNIFDGSKFLFGPSEHYVLDNSAAYFANGLRRYSPQVAPAQGGGAFVCWTHSNNHIYIKYISPEGVSKFGPTKDIGPGNTCAITTDSDGQIHIAYNNNGVKYRKIETY